MAFTTFDELKTALNDWLDRTETDVVLEDFIRLAESRMEREVRSIDMIVRSTDTLSTRFLALPTGYVDMRRVQLDTDPVTSVTQVSPKVLAERFRYSGNGRPKYFCVHEQIEFNRTPDQNYTVEMLHWAVLTRLSDSNTSNALLTNHPDLYLSSCMSEAADYLHDDMLKSKWETKYQTVRNDVNLSFRRGQWSKGPLTTTVDGPTP